ncbi:trigger factor [Psychrobium sp. MM17-31]|uniref:trigger factor n=1 Tax=Psychrobium sp. MM17-31 TaxID=2917758 RepID=UPI001EF6EA8B|nr:trigger factor [Psychrobium sp. MM17-31]MCG7530978.1 trigger factor [Psychrobium sp. MM17-31]
MQVSLETTQGLERRLTITVEAATVDSEVKKRLQQLSKTQRIDGFRPGKVPVTVIQKRYGAAVRQEVAGELMQRHYFEAVVAEKVNPAGMPQLAVVKNDAGSDLEFTATFEVYPEIEVANLDKIKVEKPVVEVTDKDLDEMLVTLQKQHATYKEVKRKSKKSDRVTIDFTGSIDGEEFEGGKAEDFVLNLSEERMIPGFEKQIVTHKAGEEFDITVTFPEDYHAENLKGKEAVFAINLKKVEDQVLPELTDEFAEKFGVTEGGIETLKADVRKNMERELNQNVKNNVKQQVIDGLIDVNEIEIPASLAQGEIQVLREQAMQRFGGQIDPKNAPQLPDELFEEQAKRRVKVGLLLGEVIKVNKLEADENRVKEMIETMASAYEDPSEVIEHYAKDEKLSQNMKDLALEDQAIDFILEQAKVKEVKKKFNDMIQQQA